MSNISSEVSSTVLHWQNTAVSFEVTVKNLSTGYASFRVSLNAAGADPNVRDSWYSLDPISSTLIPPGDTTNFRVTILNAPILGIDLINVEVKVSSVELPDINYHNLKLYIASKVERLQVSFPVSSFAIYPRKILEVPVRISNPNHYQVDTVLKIIGLENSWLERGAERRLLIGAGQTAEAEFIVQPPIVKYSPCGLYPFEVKAYFNQEEWGSARGKIEILPIGTVFFKINPSKQTLPIKASIFPQLKVKKAVYQLEFKNASNVTQNEIAVAIEPFTFDYQIVPSVASIKSGEILNVRLETQPKRPWFGMTKKHFFKVIPHLKDLRLNNTDPSSQNAELWVKPLLPLWLQLGLGAIATAILLYLFSLLSVKGHTDRVNSVTFDNDIDSALSSSRDGTVRKWLVTPDHLFCKALNWQRFCLQHQKILLGKETKNNPDQVNVVKLRSEQDLSGKFAFLGFDSGKVSKIDIVNANQSEQIVLSQQETTNNSNSAFNRILDIAIGGDFSTLFLGRGTRLLKIAANSNVTDNTPQDLIPFNTSIHAITLTSNGKNIIAGGQRNKVFWIELENNNQYRELKLHRLVDESADQITGLKVTANNLLISADNRGVLNVWDGNQCQQQTCEPIANQESSESGINAIALTRGEANNYYLAIGYTNGAIKVWTFQDDLDLFKLNLVTTIEYPQQITSIDITYQQKRSGSRLLILSGNQDHQVRLDVYQIL